MKKKYLLLRDNKESGPYSLEELSLKGLWPMDLIWVENSSSCWAYASEMDELKGMVKAAPRAEPRPAREPDSECLSMTPVSDNKSSDPVLPNPEISPETETEYLQPIAVFPDRSVEENPRKVVWNRKNLPLSDLFNIAAVFFGLVIGAVLIKKMVDGSESGGKDQLPVAAQVMEMEPVADRNYHTALVTETVLPDDLPAPGKKQTPIRSVKPKDIKRQISVNVNEYKVGVFGGISDLKLTLNNASPHQVDRMVVKLDYLKPNGEIVESKLQQVQSLAPHSSKVISVPANNRGVKIRYSITSIYSKEYKLALKQV